MTSLDNIQTASDDEARCTLCNRKSPKLHCNTCKSNLCKQCVGDHTASQLTIQHNITAYGSRDTSIKHSVCTSHVNFSCELNCDDCSVPVCSQCCTETHQGHKVTDITILYSIKQGTIKRDIEILEGVVIPEYQKLIGDMKCQISILQNEYLKLRKLISIQGEKWHQEVDNAIAKYQKEIDEMEADDLARLNQCLSDIQNQSSLIYRSKQNYIDILNSNESINLLEYESKTEEMRKMPSTCRVSPPTFQPYPITCESIYQQFGTMNTSINAFTEGYKVKLPSGAIESIGSIDTKYNELRRVSCASSEQAWICQSREDLRRFDIHGSLLEAVKIESGHRLKDMTVTKHGHLVYIVIGLNSVFHVKQGKIETIITLMDWRPRGICSTSDGEFLVCMVKGKHRRVVRYCGPRVEQEILYDEIDTTRRLNGTNHLFITENSKKDVWLSDNEGKNIVVTDQSGKFKFRYTGSLESKKYESFYPYCIDSDGQGHVFVIDLDNNCIHIVDDGGHLLRYIDSLNNPRDLSVDSNDQIWIGERDGKVKIVKYLKFRSTATRKGTSV